MNTVKAYTLRVHKNAGLSCAEYEDKLDLMLINKSTGKTSEKSYYKIAKGITIGEVAKIDSIIYFMHNDIDLNLWEV